MPESPPEIRLRNRSAMKSEWRELSDVMPSAARVAGTIYGFMAFDPLRWCLARHQERSFNKLRLRFDSSCLGFSALRDDWRPVNAIDHRPMTGPSQTALKQATQVPPAV